MSVNEQIVYKKADLLADYWGFVNRQIAANPHKPFVVTQSGSATFSEIDQYSNVLQFEIKRAADNFGTGVGIFLKDPRKIVSCMIGVLKANDFFVVLDTSFPQETLRSMIEDAGIELIITETGYLEEAQTFTSDRCRYLNLDEIDLSAKVQAQEFSYSLRDYVQIMFTSGTSGKPKGAIEDYQYLIRSVYLKTNFYGYTPEDRLLQLASLSFSGPHTGVFAALVMGISIYFYPLKEEGFAKLPAWIRDNEVTNYQSTVTTFRSFVSTLKPDDRFPSITNFHISGEKRLVNDVLLLQKHFPNVQNIRLSYTGTEMQSVSSSIVPLKTALSNESLPSGKVHGDIKVFIWDENNQPLPAGEEGEIVVYSNELVRGYINNPELSAQRFITDGEHPDFQYFKTGDLGKILEDGQLMVLGRADNMVKIKGVRIELASIENYLAAYPGIVHVASKVFEDAKKIKRLATYYTVEDGLFIPVSDLRKYLAAKFPLNQLPSYLLNLEKMPMTSGGKISFDRLPLPAMVRPALGYPYAAPVSETEKKLTAIWEEHIGISGIGVNDDFFDVGGDSLIAVIIFVDIESTFSKELPVSTLLKAPTIRELAKIIEGKVAFNSESAIIPIRPAGTRPPIFFIPGRGGYPTRIRHLAKKIAEDFPIYAFQNTIKEDSDHAPREIIQIAAEFLSEIKKVLPRGPYILAGESMGGKIAYEIAQQELQNGGEKPWLFMLDTYNAENPMGLLRRTKKRSPYYTMLLKKHASIWFNSDWEGKKDYLRFYKETILKKLSRMAGHRINHVKDLAKNSLPSSYADTAIENCEASRRYELKPYPGEVVLVMAMRGPGTNIPAHGWDKVGIKDLKIKELDCYHGSMLFEPAVSQLAIIIQSHIDASTEGNRR